MTAIWFAPLALTITLQLVTAGASIGRVSTSNDITSRGCNALALGAIAADFAVKYFWTGRADDVTVQIVVTHRADDLTGLLIFAVLTLRTLLILCIGSLYGSLLARRTTCAVAFAICVACTIAAQNIGVYAFRMTTLLPAIGIGLGCLGEASDDTVLRRRCILSRQKNIFAMPTWWACQCGRSFSTCRRSTETTRQRCWFLAAARARGPLTRPWWPLLQ